MSDKPTDKPEVVTRAAALLADMVMELHLSGCDDDHPLVRRAAQLIPLLKITAGQLTDRPGPAPVRSPERLHLMTAEEVSLLDLGDLTAPGLAPHTRAELAEAAFTFENELMALLEDDNTMPMDAYVTMAEDQLKEIIRTAVGNICRLRSC